MESIKNKKAYWGRFTFEAIPEIIGGEEIVRLNVYRNLPYKFENSFLIKAKEDLIDTSPIGGLKCYTGDLSGKTIKRIKTLTPKSRKETMNEIRVPVIDVFVESFRYDL
jgi:hypothetical protein